MTQFRLPSRALTDGIIGCSMLLAGFVTGCLASPADIAEAEESEVASTEEALVRGGSNQQRLGYTCTGGKCECSKAIENDCEDMTADCTAGTVDDVITCIDGWLTTDCVCTHDTGFVRPKWNGAIVNTDNLGNAAVWR